jgi:P27 family predicted phage terminase small subunit
VVGPKPKPTCLKILNGEPNKRRINFAEPKPSLKRPHCPSFLSKEAKKEWRRIAPQLERSGVLSKIDGAALAAYCTAWARWVDAERILQKSGVLVKAPSGFPMQSPLLAIANKAMHQMVKILTEFGMTPSSRSRIRIDDSGSEDGEDLLS